MTKTKSLLTVAVAAVLITALGGCDFLAVTDQQLVKNKLRDHAQAITLRDWRTAASFYDSTVKWQQGQKVLEGRNAAKGFLGTLNDIHNMDEFFIIVHSTKKIREDVIEAAVTCQAHIVISSTELNFTNRFWDARIGWVKRGPGKWLICYIIEVTERKEGRFTRL